MKKINEIINKFVHSTIFTILITAVITLLFITYIAQPSLVQGTSMDPTLHNGQILIIEKMADKYERFSIVVIKIEKSVHYVKRIIGCPGETVQMIDGYVYINGNKLDDKIDIKSDYAGIAESPIILKENEYFVLGDNRNNSKDSRFESVGIINGSSILGKVILPYNI